MTRHEVENKEINTARNPVFLDEKITYSKPIPKEEKIKNIQKNFKDLIKRELTEKELEKYLKLFENGKTNIWKFAEQISVTDE